jgi:hypothetical protein
VVRPRHTSIQVVAPVWVSTAVRRWCFLVCMIRGWRTSSSVCVPACVRECVLCVLFVMVCRAYHQCHGLSTYVGSVYGCLSLGTGADSYNAAAVDVLSWQADSAASCRLPGRVMQAAHVVSLVHVASSSKRWCWMRLVLYDWPRSPCHKQLQGMYTYVAECTCTCLRPPGWSEWLDPTTWRQSCE